MFKFRKRKKSQGLRSGEYGGWGITGMPFEVKNWVGEGSVTWEDVIMEHTFVCNVLFHANDTFF
jgi:hypothetical protein